MSEKPFFENPFMVTNPGVDSEVLRLKELHLKRVTESSTFQEGLLIIISKLIEMTRLLSKCFSGGDASEADECAMLAREVNEEERILTRHLASSGIRGNMWTGLLRFPYRLERIGDMLEAMLHCFRVKVRTGIPFTDKAHAELDQLFTILLDMMIDLQECFRRPNQELLDRIAVQGLKVSQMVDDFRKAHWKRMEAGICAPAASSVYREILDSIKWANEYLEKICESLVALEQDSEWKDSVNTSYELNA
jgi:Na+/phosphate symporter